MSEKEISRDPDRNPSLFGYNIGNGETNMPEYFQYGETEMDYLRKKDKILGDYIQKTGMIYREVDTDLFSSVIHHIIGQQISNKAQATIWNRIRENRKEITPDSIASCSRDLLQSFGMTYWKADNILDFARKARSGEFDIESVKTMSDKDAIVYLSSLKGIGVWTAEMILLFSLERKDIFSYDDLAIQRGLRILYHHRKITRKLFEKYRRRFSPYCSIASLYLWKISGQTTSSDEKKEGKI